MLTIEKYVDSKNLEVELKYANSEFDWDLEKKALQDKVKRLQMEIKMYDTKLSDLETIWLEERKSLQGSLENEK